MVPKVAPRSEIKSRNSWKSLCRQLGTKPRLGIKKSLVAECVVPIATVGELYFADGSAPSEKTLLVVVSIRVPIGKSAG
jgi:hypothetical protein